MAIPYPLVVLDQITPSGDSDTLTLQYMARSCGLIAAQDKGGSLCFAIRSLV
jgi:hypothetical protein